MSALSGMSLYRMKPLPDLAKANSKFMREAECNTPRKTKLTGHIIYIITFKIIIFSGIARRKTKPTKDSHLGSPTSRKMGIEKETKTSAFIIFDTLILEKVIEGSRAFIKSTPSHTSNKELGEFGWTILNLIGSGKGENISNFTVDSMPVARALGVMVRHASAAGRLTSR